ncbi:NAD(P)(+) transhydrogenase (Re/Si-specific) subunit alpha, partial [Cereibacter sp. SYSU M97828]|nr:NAD(P)(+) transhydrogenase (Re/Si-specific) subunit alpha [Cereibacter flavus]
MKIGAAKEIFAGEARVAMTPESALQLQKLGHSCLVEAGAGAKAGFTDDAYRGAGVEVVDDVYAAADVVVKVRGPEPSEAEKLREGQTLISFFWPAQNEALLEQVKARGATVVAMD